MRILAPIGVSVLASGTDWRYYKDDGKIVRIALLEDDLDQSKLLLGWLKDEGHSVTEFHDGTDFLRHVLRDSFDMLLLDWELPGMSGLDVLKRFRRSERSYTPVLFLTVKSREADVVRALESGADDYMIKPVRRKELVARIKASSRRIRAADGPAEMPNTDPYLFDQSKKSVKRDGEKIELTHREFDLAVFLFRNVGRIISRAHLLESIWGLHVSSVSTRTVDTHVSRIRKKLDLSPERGWKLTAIYQQGYKLERFDE